MAGDGAEFEPLLPGRCPFISLADTWLSCQSNMLQPVPKQQHSRVIRYKSPLCHLSTHSQLLGVVINLPTKLLLLTPGFVFMFAKSWGHKTCLYGIGDCSQLRLTTAVMLGRWLEVKVTRLRSVSLLQTNTPPPPPQQNIPLLSVMFAVWVPSTLGQSDPICTLQPQPPALGQREGGGYRRRLLLP